uniref:Uncharacterized protein n=1 Tax=Heterorhabditis bacteriophora TaxID=37862 RepID=A0A1I7X2S6_HETBA
MEVSGRISPSILSRKKLQKKSKVKIMH